MNRRLCAWVGSLFCCLALAGPAFAQVALPPSLTPTPPSVAAGTPIPLGAQTALVLTQPVKDQISKFIQEQFNALSGTDFTAQATARKTLVGALSAGSQPAYYAWFIHEWAAASTAAISKNVSLGVRLNIAIVTSTLAASSQSMDIDPLVRQLLADREPAVVLWAIKAAKPLVVIVLQTQSIPQSPLVKAMVDAVKKHGGTETIGGFIALDAYRALNITGVPGVPDAVIKPKISTLVLPILDIMEYRISLHAIGLVQSPGAEREIATFLSGQYLSVSPSTQKRMVQDLVNLETYAGQRAALYQNNPADLAQIRLMLTYVTSPLNVIDPPAVNGLGWLSHIPLNATPADIVAHTDKVFALLRINFSWLVTPPTIPTIEPPPLTTPASATTPGAIPPGTTPSPAPSR